jgi:aminoglycoside phosphotransferase (APT) family kinase protein
LLEERLVGERPAAIIPPRLVDDCVEFLAHLYRIGAGATSPASSAADRAAETVAEADLDAVGEELVAVARLVDDALGQIAGGFAHGDFWTGNLLVRAGRLAGVVDWGGGSAGTLPFLDVLHLLVNAERLRRRQSLGEHIANSLLPAARRGDVPQPVVAYGRAIGIDPDREMWSHLVLAYWLEQVRRHVLALRGEIDLQQWADANVRPVIAIA